jgi:hypothetical protein
VSRPGFDGSYFGFESGGHSEPTSIGLPPLCTVGAAELAPPASGRIALFSIAAEFDVVSPALPVVAADDVVQLVSGLSRDGAVDCANAVPATNDPAKIAAAMRAIIFISRARKIAFSNPGSRTFGHHDGSIGSFARPAQGNLATNGTDSTGRFPGSEQQR